MHVRRWLRGYVAAQYEQCAVQASGAPFAGEEYTVAARTIIAQRIIALAKEGQLDGRLLTSAALIHLAQQKLSKTSPNS